MLSWNTLLTISADDLRSELRNNFYVSLPSQIISIEDMHNAQLALGHYASNYSFLSAMSVEIKGLKRKAKREKESKEMVDMLMEKEELLSTYSENMKMAYNAVSRMISVRQQINDELRMTGANPV